MTLAENKGAINHLLTHSLWVASVRNVDFIKIDKDGIKLTIKINKFCTTKIKQNIFNNWIYKQISFPKEDDNKENFNTANIE